MNKSERRVAACLKACKGIPTKKLESMQAPFVDHLKSLGAIAQEKTEQLEDLRAHSDGLLEIVKIRNKQWELMFLAILEAKQRLTEVPETDSQSVNLAYNALLDAYEAAIRDDDEEEDEPEPCAPRRPEQVEFDVIHGVRTVGYGEPQEPDPKEDNW